MVRNGSDHGPHATCLHIADTGKSREKAEDRVEGN